jgi:demethylmenaquinone methyltransferase/2-methoxy-6-polyprenyl-1,4-benzoquinol methylase
MSHKERDTVHAPHPPLKAYYSSEAERGDWVRGIFDRTAGDYERVESAMGLGSGARYRRDALARAGLAPGMRVIDVGTGTGLLAREAVRIVGDPAAVIGVDPSAGMRRHAHLPEGVRLLAGEAEAIPLPDASADFLCMGYALRHISDLEVAFREFRRVLAPGGVVCILEITPPASRLGRAALKAYMRGFVPLLARAIARSRETPRLMRYYWDTIEACAPPEAVLATLAHAGFVEAARRAELGIFSEYRAVKPPTTRVQ